MKKQFLTFALLATVALGGAFAGNSAGSKILQTAGPLNSTSPTCSQIDIPCRPAVDGDPTCTVNSVPYFRSNGTTCIIPLTEIPD